jgi:single-strand DNA-binding protein
MNKVILQGRFMKDLEIRTSQGGTSILSFTLAVNRKFNKEGEEKQADFIQCKAFGKTADNISRFFNKGNLIIIEGRIQTGSYEKEGQRIYTTDVMVDGFEFTGEKRTREDQQQPEQASFEVLSIEGEESLPF